MGFSGPSWHNSKTWNLLMTWSTHRCSTAQPGWKVNSLQQGWGLAEERPTWQQLTQPLTFHTQYRVSLSEKSTLLPILAALWIKRAAQTETSLPVRVGKTRAAFITLKHIWASKKIAIITKLCTLNANVKSVLPYRSEKRRMTFSRSVGKNNYKKLGAVGERIARTSTKTDPEALVGTDKSYPEETNIKHHNPRLTPRTPMEMQERTAYEHLKVGHWWRAWKSGIQLDCGSKNSPETRSVKECCGWPMLHWEPIRT